jgi:hypothetical protein
MAGGAFTDALMRFFIQHCFPPVLWKICGGR